jgi:hypothetical protein
MVLRLVGSLTANTQITAGLTGFPHPTPDSASPLFISPKGIPLREHNGLC